MTVSDVVYAVAVSGYVFGVVLLLRKVFTRRGRAAIGPGAAGTYYDLLGADRRQAIEIVAEKRAEQQDPENRDGNLPDLAGGSVKD